ncbi:MAG: hypothetical protein R3A12_16380 [Ignavibacteria bacterium]
MSQINESAIKTQCLYVNEIPSFPPSVAQVATAIPAFIGYTQKAVDTDEKFTGKHSYLLFIPCLNTGNIFRAGGK